MKTKLLKRLRKQISIYYYPNCSIKFFLIKTPTLYQSIVNFWKEDALGFVPYPQFTKSFKTLAEAKEWILCDAFKNYKEFSRRNKIAEIQSLERTKNLLVRIKVWHNKI